jgi:CheY-like chemotaxis protein
VIQELLGALIGIEPDGTILSWNKCAETLFGFTSADPARPEFASQGWPRGPGRSEGGLGRSRCAGGEMTPHDVDILLVEDHAPDAELTLHALRLHTVESRVYVVHDGGPKRSTSSFCRGPFAGRSFASPPTVVLLDLKLPKVDGLEVLRQVKTDPRTRAIPVVVLTSSKVARDILHSYRLGVNSYVQKPVDFTQFRAAVKELGAYWLSLNEPPPAGAVAAEGTGG